jgi:aminoglycoside phosphotransferase (APT) family kinase protein
MVADRGLKARSWLPGGGVKEALRRRLRVRSLVGDRSACNVRRVATGAIRDDTTLTRGFAHWLREQRPGRRDLRIDALIRPKSGWSNETVIVDCSWAGGNGEGTDAGREQERLVVRLPLVTPSYPSYELHNQAAVLDVLAGAGIPAPRAFAVEDDEQWLGAPFFVMTFVTGDPVGEAPALDRRLLARPVEDQRRIQAGFLEALAAVHRVDLDGPAAREIRVLRRGVPAEVEYWTAYASWASGGAPAAVLADALNWCARTIPEAPPSDSLLWGDARLGNVLYDDDGNVEALLDWELATIGPAEMDLGWYLVLDELTNGFVGRTVPGFATRADAIGRYERALGREVVHLAWHEIFALARSIAINDCQARLAAAAGTPYPGVPGDANPVLVHLDARISAFAG